MLDRLDEPSGTAGDWMSGDARAWRALAGLSAGDHACCAFCDDDDQRGIVRRFALDALDGGMRLLYLADGSSDDAVHALLTEAGVDVGARRAAGQLEVGRAAETCLDGGSFDPQRQIARLAERIDEARAAGFRALAVTTEMSWALGSGTDPDRLVAYERAVQRVFEGGEIAGLCQYDALTLPDGLRHRIARAHPLAIATGPAGTVATLGQARVAEQAGVAGLQLAGEIDAFSAAYVGERIAEHFAEGRDVVLDLSELTFADVAAARTFVELAESLDPGLRIVLEGSPPVLRRVLRLCSWEDRPSLVLRDETAPVPTPDAVPAALVEAKDGA